MDVYVQDAHYTHADYVGRRGLDFRVCLFLCLEHNSKTNGLKVFKLGMGNDVGIPSRWYCFRFKGQRLRSQGQLCIFHINVRSIPQKTNDPKVFKLDIGNTFGMSCKWHGLGLKGQRSTLRLGLTAIRRGFELYECLLVYTAPLISNVQLQKLIICLQCDLYNKRLLVGPIVREFACFVHKYHLYALRLKRLSQRCANVSKTLLLISYINA